MPVSLIVPTLCVGMHPVTLRVTSAQDLRLASSEMRSVPGGVPTQSVGMIRCTRKLWGNRGPRSRTGARACRTWAWHRPKGARALGYLGLFQVTRRKGGTASRRYRKNGYAPD